MIARILSILWFRQARRTVLKLFENIFNCFDLFLDICIYIKNPIPQTWDHKFVLLTPSCGYPKFLHSTDKCKCILSLGSKIISAISCNNIACKMQSGLLINFLVLFLFLLSLVACWLLRSHKAKLVYFHENCLARNR